MIGTAGEFATWCAVRGIDLGDAAEEALLTTASARLAKLCNRRLEALAGQTLTLRGSGNNLLRLDEEMVEITAVTVDDADYQEDTDWYAYPRNTLPIVALETAYGYWPESSTIAVTGTLGYTAEVPPDLVEACYWLAAELIRDPAQEITKQSVINVTLEFGARSQPRSVEHLIGPHIRASL